MNCLARNPWPGNVRELSNLLERLAILYPEQTISAKDLPERYRSTGTAGWIGSGVRVTPPLEAAFESTPINGAEINDAGINDADINDADINDADINGPEITIPRNLRRRFCRAAASISKIICAPSKSDSFARLWWKPTAPWPRRRAC